MALKRAYVILAHEQPRQLARLCEALDAPDARCIVHWDASQGPCPPLPPNAEPVPDPIAVHHGGFSQTRATVASLRHAAAQPFDYVFVLTGRDYPIKTDRALLEFLARHRGQSFISFYPMAPGTPLYHHVAQRFFVDERMGLPERLRPLAMNLERAERRLLPERRFPFGHVPYRGSAYFALTRQVADYVLAFLDTDDGARYMRFFRRSWGSDEMLFQSVVLNSPLATTCRHYERDRAAGLTHPNDAHLHYVDWDPARERPAVLDERDLDALLASEAFFARKVDAIRSQRLLEELDALR